MNWQHFNEFDVQIFLTLMSKICYLHLSLKSLFINIFRKQTNLIRSQQRQTTDQNSHFPHTHFSCLDIKYEWRVIYSQNMSLSTTTKKWRRKKKWDTSFGIFLENNDEFVSFRLGSAVDIWKIIVIKGTTQTHTHKYFFRLNWDWHTSQARKDIEKRWCLNRKKIKSRQKKRNK